MQRLPFWGQVLLMAVLAALIVGVGYWVKPGLKDMGEKVRRLEAEYTEKEKQIGEGQIAEKNLPELERKNSRLQRQLSDARQVLPKGPETGDLLREIKNMTDQANLDLKSFSPGALKPVDFYKEFPIEMDVVGRYHDLGVFLDRVSKYSRIINVDNLRMSSNPGGGDKTIRAGFTATTFVDEEPAGERPEEAKR